MDKGKVMNAHEKVNILMVDDQPSKLLSYEVILSELGENLIKATSGREALEHLLKTDIAVVLMDVRMPEMDGITFLKMLRRSPLWKDMPVIVLTARESFIQKNRAAMADFMEDTLRIVRWYLDPANHEEVAKIAAKITKAPPERFGWLFTKQDTYRDPDLMPNLDALQKNIDETQKLGFIKQKIDIKNYADLSLVKEAIARVDKK